MDVRSARFPLVDSLRGLAAIAVVAYHAATFSGLPASLRFLRAWVIQSGFVAVAVFFAISGFLLYRPFVLSRFEQRGRPDTRAYAWRRFLRIVPGFWVAITIAGLWVGPEPWTGYRALENYGFLQVYLGPAKGVVLPQGWTLGIEVVLYALLPIWALAMGALKASSPARRLRQELVGVGAIAAVALVYSALASSLHAPFAVTYSPVALLLQFSLGMLVAVASAWTATAGRDRSPRLLERLVLRAWPCWLAAGTVMLIDGWLAGPGHPMREVFTPGEHMWRQALSASVAVALLAPAVFGSERPGLGRRLLSSRVLGYVGVVSFGLYLYHIPVMEQVKQLQGEGHLGSVSGWGMWFLAAIAGGLVLGSLSWYLVERPALSLKRRGFGRARQAAADPLPSR